MRIPVGARRADPLLDRLPGKGLPPLERRRSRDLPLRLNQVQTGRIRRLNGELPARMGQSEEHDVGRFVRRQIIENRIDPLHRGRNRHFELVEEIDEIPDRAARAGRRLHFTAGRLERTEDIAIGGSALIIKFLFAAPCGFAHTRMDRDEFLTGVRARRECPISSRQTTTPLAGEW